MSAAFDSYIAHANAPLARRHRGGAHKYATATWPCRIGFAYSEFWDASELVRHRRNIQSGGLNISGEGHGSGVANDNVPLGYNCHLHLVHDADGDLLPLSTGGRYVYDAYGNDVRGAAVTGNPYRYTGRRLDAQTGLYYYRARYYDPKIGKFLQTDPIGYEDQMNLYNYVGNDPLNLVDPSGEGKIKWFVETAKGVWKRLPTRKQAVNSRLHGKNIDVQGPGASKHAKRIENQVQGDARVARHDQHPNSDSIGPHYQPARRRPRSDKKKKGHTNYNSAKNASGIAVAISFEEMYGSNSFTKAIDFLNPAQDVAYVADSAIDAATAVDEKYGISEKTTEKATSFAIDLENWARSLNGG